MVLQVLDMLLPWAADAAAVDAYEVCNILLEIAAAAAVAPMLAVRMLQVSQPSKDFCTFEQV